MDKKIKFFKTSEVEIDFNDAFFSGNLKKYNHDTARFCSVLTALGYYMPAKFSTTGDCILKDAYTAAGFENPVFFPCTGRKQVDYSVAEKKSGEWTYIYVIIVGSYLGQWYENFDCGTGELHKGFCDARDFVYDGLCSYLKDRNVKKDKTKILLSGHSRGGAAAAMLAQKLMSEERFADKENIFAYTFASPNYALKGCAELENTAGIFNIVNDEDFVTRCMPNGWGYVRFGEDYILPISETGKMQKFYSKITDGKTFFPYKKGLKTVDKLFALMEEKISGIDDYYNLKLRHFNDKISIYEFFTRTICPIVGEPPKSAECNNGVKLLMKTFILRFFSDDLFVSVADFFIIYEGFAMVTKGKISKNYFSLAHDIFAYCAFMNTISEGELKKLENR